MTESCGVGGCRRTDQVRLTRLPDDGRLTPVLSWQPGPGWRMISSGVLGGGLGARCWWLNAGVPLSYARLDPAVHLTELAAGLSLTEPGVGMLTAAEVTRWSCGHDGDAGGRVDVTATVGLGLPVPAAASRERIAAERVARVGTINVLVVLPVALADAALVNAVLTATEAKTQALAEAGVPGTGTASDSICIACPEPHGDTDDPGEPCGGPRSPWGSRLARAVHAAVATGTADWSELHPGARQG
jgi:adenosylcobinamide hydrolase